MFEFLRIQYQLGRVTVEQLARLVMLGRITQSEMDQIVGDN